jgi:phosphomannomutase/phosphoglucomutase
MKEIGAPFTGEMSGHFFFADEYFGFDDAIYAGARLIRILAMENRPLSELLKDVPRFYSTPETRIPCPEEQKAWVVAGLTEAFRSEGHEVIDVDGARVLFPNGWALIRASNTQPVLVTRCEATTAEALAQITSLVSAQLLRYSLGKFSWTVSQRS